MNQAAKLLGRDEAELRHELASCRAKLLTVRNRRVPPAKDTKVLVSWNGLMIAALAEGGLIIPDQRYLEAAGRASSFILDRMRRDDGRLLHTYRDGQAKLDAYLDDYASFIDGLTRLYEATGEPRWIEAALDLAEIMIGEFTDREQGGFFFTGNRHESLIARPKDVHDNATPSGNGLAAMCLIRLGALTGRDSLTEAGRTALLAVGEMLEREPAAAGQSLIALDLLLGPIREFAVIAGADATEFRTVLETIAAPFLPHKVVAPATAGQAGHLAAKVPLLVDRPAREHRTTTYICEGSTCQPPIVGLSEVQAALIEATGRE
jgi:uncharacterized protein YyaL (SSP411 family)